MEGSPLKTWPSNQILPTIFQRKPLKNVKENQKEMREEAMNIGTDLEEEKKKEEKDITEKTKSPEKTENIENIDNIDKIIRMKDSTGIEKKDPKENKIENKDLEENKDKGGIIEKIEKIEDKIKMKK